MTAKIHISGLIFMAILAAIIATICDAIHVYTQTLSYPNPWYFGQACWVLPGFFIAFMFMGICYAFLASKLHTVIHLKASTSFGSQIELIECLTTFALVYILSGFGNFDPTVLCIILYSTFLIRWLFSYDRMWLLILAILLAIGGMFAEGLLADFGQVKYRHSDIFNVPYWLGAVYMHGAFALRAGMRALVYHTYHH
ncbi:hypothetical protein G9F32_06710 [Acinetobacter sp. 194]|nr:hypothetical protein [Acinetobacter shaoyimingii]